jgi:Leucine-rich repeat (LRR) protein/NADH:ubiquinone oxidoreductase subunit C
MMIKNIKIPNVKAPNQTIKEPNEITAVLQSLTQYVQDYIEGRVSELDYGKDKIKKYEFITECQIACKLALKVIQEANNYTGMICPKEEYYDKLHNKEAIRLYHILIGETNLEDEDVAEGKKAANNLDMLCKHSNIVTPNRKLSFWGTNYTNYTGKFKHFLDKLRISTKVDHNNAFNVFSSHDSTSTIRLKNPTSDDEIAPSLTNIYKKADDDEETSIAKTSAKITKSKQGAYLYYVKDESSDAEAEDFLLESEIAIKPNQKSNRYSNPRNFVTKTNSHAEEAEEMKRFSVDNPSSILSQATDLTQIYGLDNLSILSPEILAYTIEFLDKKALLNFAAANSAYRKLVTNEKTYQQIKQSINLNDKITCNKIKFESFLQYLKSPDCVTKKLIITSSSLVGLFYAAGEVERLTLILEALTSNKTVTHLNLSGCIDQEIKTKTLQALTNNKTLTHLNLSKCHLIDSDLKGISKLTNLKSLDLSSNEITDDGAKHISKLTNLEKLNLAYNRIMDNGVGHISTLTNLEKLNLAYNNIGPAGANSLLKLTKLKNLSLSSKSNSIGMNGAKYLSQLTNLKRLDLCHNNIGTAGAKYISKLINLKDLSLHSNQIDDEGAEYISKLTKLERLILSYNNIGPGAAKHIFKLINLKELDLIGTKIGNEFTKNLSELTKLKKLNRSIRS